LGTSQYDPAANHCYVRISFFAASASLIHLYDGQTKELLAWTQITADQKETGVIDAAEVGLPYESREGHAAYLKAKAFIDAHMRDK
jgi:hypothetical protein